MPNNQPTALIQIERCVIGALLTGTDVTEVQEHLSTEMFHNNDNRTIFSIIKNLDDEGTAVSYITVAGRMEKMGSGEDPSTYLTACIHLLKKEQTFVLGNYCHEIKMAFATMRIAETCETGLKLIKSKKPISEILRSIEVDVVEISGLQKNSSEDDIKNAAHRSIGRMSDAKAGNVDEGVQWAFKGLKTVADGNMQFGNFHAILLDSAGGKSSVALQIIRHAAEQGTPTLFVSFEQDSVQCLRQMSSQKLGIESKRMRTGDFSEEEFNRVYGDHDSISILPIEIEKASGWGADDICARIRRFSRKNGKGLVVIDHAKSILLGKESMFAEQINSIYKKIRDELSTSEMAGLLLMQRKSSAISRENPAPIKSDAYGGDATNEPLDLLIGMWRPEQIYKQKLAFASSGSRQNEQSEKEKYEQKILQNEGKAKLLCLKNRYGDENAKAELDWEPKYTRFSDVRSGNSINYLDKELEF